MDDNLLGFVEELSTRNASFNYSNSSDCLENSEGNDIIPGFNDKDFDDLLGLSSILDFEAESGYSSDCLLTKAATSVGERAKLSDSNSHLTISNTFVKRDTQYLDDNQGWRYTVKYDPRPISKRSQKRTIPEARKDDAYWRKRSQNTERARKSREARRVKEIEVLKKVKALELEKVQLQQQVYNLKAQLACYSQNDCVMANRWHI